MQERIEELSRTLAAQLQERQMMLSTAESCTGGWVAKVLTDLAGSSNWFDRGFVTYSNAAKQEMLGVQPDTLEQHGAVSEAAVAEMALGAIANSRADVALSISGIAGPDGGSMEKPVGTVWFGWAREGEPPVTRCICFEGDREAVRQQAVLMALDGMVNLLG